jgi:cytochrome P450
MTIKFSNKPFPIFAELENDDIAAQALAFFMAGFDTTSTLLCFASHQLAVRPEIQSRLQEEIDETLHEHGGKLTYEALQGMKYLDMVVSGEKNMWAYLFAFSTGVYSSQNRF